MRKHAGAFSLVPGMNGLRPFILGDRVPLRRRFLPAVRFQVLFVFTAYHHFVRPRRSLDCEVILQIGFLAKDHDCLQSFALV